MMKRPNQINCRLSDAELQAIAAACAKAGMTPTEWLRVVATHAAGHGELAVQLARAARLGERGK